MEERTGGVAFAGSPASVEKFDPKLDWEWFEDPAVTLRVRGPAGSAEWKVIAQLLRSFYTQLCSECPKCFQVERITTSGGRPKRREQ